MASLQDFYHVWLQNHGLSPMATACRRFTASRINTKFTIANQFNRTPRFFGGFFGLYFGSFMMASNLATKKILFVLLAILVSWQTHSFGAVISATTPLQHDLLGRPFGQDGARSVTISGPAVVKLGEFSFPTGFSTFAEVRFRAWVDLAGLPATLILQRHPLIPSFGLSLDPSDLVLTSLSIQNFPNSTGVDERQSAWAPLSASDGIKIANFINERGGTIDAFLLSSSKSLGVPSATHYFNFSTSTFSTFPYLATIDLLTTNVIPEPTSGLIFIGSLCSVGILRRLTCRRK